MSHFERFVTEGNEKAYELAKAGEQCWTKDLWRKREERQRSKKEKRCAFGRSQKEKWNFVDQKREETKHRMHRTQIFVGFLFAKNWESDTRVMRGKKKGDPNWCLAARPEQVNTKEHGKMLKRIQLLEDGRVPAKEATHGKLKDKKEESRGKSIMGC